MTPDPEEDPELEEWEIALEEARKPWGQNWPYWLSRTYVEFVPDDWRE